MDNRIISTISIQCENKKKKKLKLIKHKKYHTKIEYLEHSCPSCQ